jgi:thiamine pyrophosphate-dependent acetolactate synthase large subunit-like protein
MGSAHQYGPGAVPNARFKHRIAAAEFARSVGAHASLVHDLGALPGAFADACNEARPSLLDIVIDPTEVPPFGSRMKLLEDNFG